MTRPFFLLKENPANAKLESISFYEVVQWVSCSRITRASCCTARRAFILLAIKLSMFSCVMVGLRNMLTMCPEKGRFDPVALPRFEKDVCQLSSPS